MEQIQFEIIDDPANARVFKGPGHFTTTRAETAIRQLEAAFPELRLQTRSDPGLSNLVVSGYVRADISSDEFIRVLTEAMTATGTRMAPTC